MSKTTSQVAKVLRHLSNRKSVTINEALSRYGVQRLAARIYDIRNTFNIDIATTKVNSAGRTVTSYRVNEKNARKAKNAFNTLTA